MRNEIVVRLLSIRPPARLLAILKHCDFSFLLFSTIHVNSPRRVRETRVVVAAIAAADIVVALLRELLAILVVSSSRTWRMLDHRVESLMHTSHSDGASCSAMRGGVLALPLRLREGSLRRWAESSC